MEIAIRIVVSFVVILVVGITMVTISQDLLFQGRDTVENFESRLPEDKLIEQESFTEREVGILAQQCLQTNEGLLQEELCYILRSNQEIYVDRASLNLNFVIMDTSISTKTLYLTYNMDNVTISE